MEKGTKTLPEELIDALTGLWAEAEAMHSGKPDERPTPRAYVELTLAVAHLVAPDFEAKLKARSIKQRLSSTARGGLRDRGGVTGCELPRIGFFNRRGGGSHKYRTNDGYDWRTERTIYEPSTAARRTRDLCVEYIGGRVPVWGRAAERLVDDGEVDLQLDIFSDLRSPSTAQAEPTGPKALPGQTGGPAPADAGPAGAIGTHIQASRASVESVSVVAEGPFAGAEGSLVVRTGAKRYCTGAKRLGRKRSNLFRLKYRPEDEIEELLGRSPKGEYPRLPIPTDLYEDLTDWRPILADSEPLAALIQFVLFSFRRDPDYTYNGDCTNMPIGHERVFQAFGMAPGSGWNQGINSGMLLELYRQEVDGEIDWTKPNGEAGKTRVVKAHGMPDEILEKAKEARYSPQDYEDWTMLITGQKANRRNWSAAVRKDRLNDIEDHEPVIDPPPAAKRIQEYLNGLDQTTFSHGGHGIMRSEVRQRAAKKVRETIPEEHRRDQELNKLYGIKHYPQPLYKICDRFPRQKADPFNQLMNVKSEVLRSMYHPERDYELDLSKAHLASYVPVARREGLEVPSLERYLQANLENDDDLLAGGDLWTELASAIDGEVFDDPAALRSAVKRAYSAVYGSSRSNLLHQIYLDYSHQTGDFPEEGHTPIRPLLNHELMEELLSTRDKLEVIINNRGSLKDAAGREIPLSAWDDVKDKDNRWRGVMAYVNASYEQELMGEIFNEARATQERDGYTEFQVWLYQGDGVTVRIDRRVRNHYDIIGRIQSAVEERAQELGVPTELEIDYPS